MTCFLTLFGDYYEGDRAHVLDLEVPPRPTPDHRWEKTMILLYLLVLAVLLFWFYLAYCTIWDAKKRGRLAEVPLVFRAGAYVTLIIAVVLDAIFNITVGSVLSSTSHASGCSRRGARGGCTAPAGEATWLAEFVQL